MQVNTDGYGCMALDINHDILEHEWVDADMSGVEPDVVFGKLDAMAKAMAELLGIETMHHRGAFLCAAGSCHLRQEAAHGPQSRLGDVDLTTFDVMRGYALPVQ